MVKLSVNCAIKNNQLRLILKSDGMLQNNMLSSIKNDIKTFRKDWRKFVGSFIDIVLREE